MGSATIPPQAPVIKKVIVEVEKPPKRSLDHIGKNSKLRSYKEIKKQKEERKKEWKDRGNEEKENKVVRRRIIRTTTTSTTTAATTTTTTERSTTPNRSQVKHYIEILILESSLYPFTTPILRDM